MGKNIIRWSLVLMPLMGCQNLDETAEVLPSVQADLALSLAENTPTTRMATSEVLGTGSRNIQELCIVPFAKQGTIELADRPRYYTDEGINPTGDDKENNTKRFFYSNKYTFMPGVASFLVYGRAETFKNNGIVDKSANGSLQIEMEGQQLTTLPKMVIPATLKFKPESMYESTAIPDQAKCIASYLTAIANVYGTVGTNTVYWRNTTDSWLKSIYLNFINQGNDKTYVLAGSAKNVKAFVNRLYQTLAAHTFADGSMEKAIAEAVMAKILDTGTIYESGICRMKVSVDATTKKVTSLNECDNYPADFYIPDGAAALLWTKTSETAYAFVPQTETNTQVSINSVNRFAFPAELWYYGNSRIKTNNDPVKIDIYTPLNATWEGVLSNYSYDNSIITSNTKAVAIKNPLQYGVARLSAKVYATAATLKDANNQDVTVGAESFPITGIIVDKQRPVGFDFKPLSNGESDERFIYDRHLNTNVGNTNYCLTTMTTEVAAAQSPFLHTLVLQNWETEDVTVILELQNNSGQDFKGENGIVYNGTKFYLIGKIKLSDANSTGSEDYKSRVFTQDHTTTVGMKIESLSHAYNVLPDLLGGRLEIGVQIKTDWEAAKPTTVILK